MKKIQVLPPHLVNRIAAGEVVERPASVVKELVENAIDAGATQINVSATAGGKCLRVVDNGCGIPPEELETAFLNHATSKITSPDDLDAIATLGFRGEALASVAAISRLRCVSRPQGQAHGYSYRIEGGVPQPLAPEGCREGTIMQVEDLFFNTPARLKFLKRNETELATIEEMMQGLALSHPEIKVTYTADDKPKFSTQGRGWEALPTVVQQVLKLTEADAQQLITVHHTLTLNHILYTIHAVLASPKQLNLQKKSKKNWWMLLNRRHVRCQVLSRAIQSSFETLVPHGSYPLCVLWLELPPTEVDVNVHPTKKEVRYVNSNHVFQAVQQGLRQGLVQSFESAYQLEHQPSFQPLGLHAQQPMPSTAASFSSLPSLSASAILPPAIAENDCCPESSHSHSHPHTHSYTQIPSTLPSTAYRPPLYSQAMAVQSPLPLQHPTATHASQALQERQWKVIGQLFNTYVLVETPQGLLVVDQHIASERWVFEKLMLQLQHAQPESQRLLIPKLLHVNATQLAVFETYAQWFADVGFQCEVVAGNQLAIHSFPLVYPHRTQLAPELQVQHLLEQLEQTGQAEPDVEQLISTLACHTAIRAGDVLPPEQQERLVADWLRCTLPWSCPHGRPIAHTLPSSEVNHWFDRPSLPANSLA